MKKILAIVLSLTLALSLAACTAAAREAGITRIHHVDYQAKSYVGVYTIYTIIVYGD